MWRWKGRFFRKLCLSFARTKRGRIFQKVTLPFDFKPKFSICLFVFLLNYKHTLPPGYTPVRMYYLLVLANNDKGNSIELKSKLKIKTIFTCSFSSALTSTPIFSRIFCVPTKGIVFGSVKARVIIPYLHN